MVEKSIYQMNTRTRLPFLLKRAREILPCLDIEVSDVELVKVLSEQLATLEQCELVVFTSTGERVARTTTCCLTIKTCARQMNMCVIVL